MTEERQLTAEEMIARARQEGDTLVLRAPAPSAAKLRIEAADGTSKSYELAAATTEQMLAAKRRFEALSDEDAAFDVKTWVELCATFMRREDAARFVREQPIGVVHLALRELTERATQDIQRVR